MSSEDNNGAPSSPSQFQSISQGDLSETMLDEPEVSSPTKDTHNSVFKQGESQLLAFKDFFEIRKEQNEHHRSFSNSMVFSLDSKLSPRGIKEDLSLLPYRTQFRHNSGSDCSESTIPYDDKNGTEVTIVDLTDSDSEDIGDTPENSGKHIQADSAGGTSITQTCAVHDSVEVELTIESLTPKQVEPTGEVTFVDSEAYVNDSTPGDKAGTSNKELVECLNIETSEHNMGHSGNVDATTMEIDDDRTHPKTDNNHQEGVVEAGNQRSVFTVIREPEHQIQSIVAPEVDIQQIFIKTIQGQHIPLTVPYEYLQEEEEQLLEAARRSKRNTFPLQHKRKSIAKEREFYKKSLASRKIVLENHSKILEQTVELLASNSSETLKIKEEHSKLMEATAQTKLKILGIKVAMTGVQHELSKDQFQLETTCGNDSLHAIIAEKENVIAKYCEEILKLENIQHSQVNMEKQLNDAIKERLHEEVVLRRKIEELEVQHQASFRLVEDAHEKFKDSTRRLKDLDKKYKTSLVQFMMLETRMVAVQTCRKQKKIQERIMMMLGNLHETSSEPEPTF